VIGRAFWRLFWAVVAFSSSKCRLILEGVGLVWSQTAVSQLIPTYVE
jgi:hypothetical protein